MKLKMTDRNQIAAADSVVLRMTMMAATQTMILIMDTIAALGPTVVPALPAAADLHVVAVPHAAAAGAADAAVNLISDKRKGAA